MEIPKNLKKTQDISSEDASKDEKIRQLQMQISKLLKQNEGRK